MPDLVDTVTLTECDGACLPAAAGSAIDLLQARAIVSLREPALALLERACGLTDGWLKGFLAALHDTVTALPVHDFLVAFKPSVAFFNLHPMVVERDPVGAALKLVRFVTGSPGLAAVGYVIPEEALGQSLYFPHLNVVLVGGQGPVAVQLAPGGGRLTWTDGVAADLPHPDGGVRALPLCSAAGWPILNSVAEANDEQLPVLPGPAKSLASQDLALLEDAQDLLQQVWPVAYAAMRRFLHSAIVQAAPPDHTTSVTLDFLQGTFIASLRDAVQVADAMVHEGSHARLALVLRDDPLVIDDGVARFDSPWRRDPRPLKGVINGVHAFLNVALFYRRLAELQPDLAAYATEVYETQRRKVREGWAICAAAAEPTPLGRMFLDELATEVERL